MNTKAVPPVRTNSVILCIVLGAGESSFLVPLLSNVDESLCFVEFGSKIESGTTIFDWVIELELELRLELETELLELWVVIIWIELPDVATQELLELRIWPEGHILQEAGLVAPLAHTWATQEAAEVEPIGDKKVAGQLVGIVVETLEQ